MMERPDYRFDRDPAGNSAGRPDRNRLAGLGRQCFVLVLLAMMLPAVALAGVTIAEDFSGDPATNGWHRFGEPGLFGWDSTNQELRVTWDSSRTNSYFHRPLGTVLTRDDDFQLEFDLRFEDYASGTTPGKPYAAPATIGFFNYDQATHTNFSRGAGMNLTYGPKNLVEFNFFPAFDIFLPTIDQVIVSTNNQWLYNDDNLLEMTPGQTFHVAMHYLAATRTLTTVITNNGIQYGSTQLINVPTNFDFRVTSFSVSSYSDIRDIGSIVAHGTVDNIAFTGPEPPVQNLTGSFIGGNWIVQLYSQTNWIYHLERTTNFEEWSLATPPTAGNATTLLLMDTNPPLTRAAYRVRANRP